MRNVDPIVHEPARLRIMMILSGVDSADFNFILSALAMTKGNLSSHMDKLEKAQYVDIQKGFNGKIPFTHYRLTPKGKSALDQYWIALDAIRSGAAPPTEP